MRTNTSTNARSKRLRNPLGSRVLVVAGLVLASLLVTACGGDGLSESEQKTFIHEFRQKGDAAEARALAAHPDDEKARSEAFRKDIDRLQGELLAKYGLSVEEAGHIFRTARQKGWW